MDPTPSSPSSDSGGGGLFLLLFLLIAGLVHLVVEYPKVGVPLVFGLLLGGILWYSGDGLRILGYGLAFVASLAVLGGLFWLSPVLGIVVVCLLALGWLGRSWWEDRRPSSSKGWESGILEPPARHATESKAPPSQQVLLSLAEIARQPAPTSLVRRVRAHNPRERLESIRSFDPDFSIVLFEDFLALLFTEAHLARGGEGLQRLAPYLSTSAQERLCSQGEQARTGESISLRVRDVLIGSIKFTSVVVDEILPMVQVFAEFEANFTEEIGKKERGVFVTERWMLERSREARTGPPERSRILSCPSCGAPLSMDIGSVCRYCNEVFSPGKKDWVVKTLKTLHREHQGAVLTRDVEERGNNLPTLVDPEARALYDAIAARDPEFTSSSFRRRVELIFAQLQKSWTARELSEVRPFLSDRLYQSFSYWVEEYRKQRLRNVLSGSRIVGLELARVTSDRWFDAITIRIFATGLDYLENERGELISGSKQAERPYTEYWTFLRSVQRRGPARDALDCPGCGAPIHRINMAGFCTVCSVKVTTGEFDWVLSRIEQDEAYRG